jgi:hypothetical protein
MNASLVCWWFESLPLDPCNFVSKNAAACVPRIVVQAAGAERRGGGGLGMRMLPATPDDLMFSDI